MNNDQLLPLVSVCIPVYNGSEFIEETIQSVLAQTYSNLEVVVQDNASTDKTWKLLQQYEKQFSQLSIYRNEANFGMAANWNRVINRAAGDYIMLLSADDMLMPDFIEKCFSMFQQYNVDAVAANHFFLKAGSVRPRRRLVAPGIYQNYCGVILWYNPFSVNFTLFTKEIVERMKVNGGLFRSFMTCDYDLCLRLSMADVRLAYTDERLGVYRVHNSNLSKQLKKMMRQTSLVLLLHKKRLRDNCGMMYRLTLFRFVIRSLYKLISERIKDKRLLVVLCAELCREVVGFYGRKDNN